MLQIYSAKEFFTRTDFTEEYMQAYDTLSSSAKVIVRSKNKALNQFLSEKENNSKEMQKHREEQYSQISLFTSQLEAFLYNGGQ